LDGLPDPVAADAQSAHDGESADTEEAANPLPDFLTQPLGGAKESVPEPASISIPSDPDIDSIVVTPGVLTALGGVSRLNADVAARILPVVKELRDLQERLGKARS
jgi:hypothetical protein